MQITLRSIKHATINEKIDTSAGYDPYSTSIKYGSLSFIEQNCDPNIVELVKQAPIKGLHKYIVVDVKIHELAVGECPALRHWHIDCITHPHHPAREENNHLLIVGENTTEFLKHDINIIGPDYPELFARYNITQPSIQIPNHRYVSYGRLPHRAPIVRTAERRLLIRVTESDIMKPRNQILEPSKQKVRI